MLRMLNIHASSPTDLAGLLFDLPGLDPVLMHLSFISELITPLLRCVFLEECDADVEKFLAF